MDVAGVPPSSWWGRFEFGEQAARTWIVGPCNLQVERRSHEWRITHWESESESEIVGGRALEAQEVEGATVLRLATRSRTRDLEVLPAMPDRTVVARPEVPLTIPAGEEVALFVGGPLWIRLRELDPERELVAIPAARPSDTWFGPSTMEGELAYASRTAARLTLDNLSLRPHRVLTRVVLRNRTIDSLTIERIHLPSPCLSVYVDASGWLWTEDVSVTVSENTAEASVEILHRAPREAPKASLVSEAQYYESPNILARALSALRI